MTDPTVVTHSTIETTESFPTEQIAAISEAVETEAEIPETGAESVAVPTNYAVDADAEGIPFWNIGMWILGVALAAAIIAAVVARSLRTKTQTIVPIAPTQAPDDILEFQGVQVGKLHGIGARECQQDSFSVSPPESLNSHGLLTVLADGMGGLSHGELVSQTAVSAIIHEFLSTPPDGMEQTLWKLLHVCNNAINDMLEKENLRKGGSTLLMGLLRDHKFLWLGLGDSRLALWRNGVLLQLNREHLYRWDLLLRYANGDGTLESVYSHSKGGGLTSYLGQGELKAVDMPASAIDVFPGDVLIFMSDGVYNALSEQEISSSLQGTAQQMAEELGRKIAEKKYPQQDNYTAIILKLGSAGKGDVKKC